MLGVHAMEPVFDLFLYRTWVRGNSARASIWGSRSVEDMGISVRFMDLFKAVWFRAVVGNVGMV